MIQNPVLRSNITDDMEFEYSDEVIEYVDVSDIKTKSVEVPQCIRHSQNNVRVASRVVVQLLTVNFGVADSEIGAQTVNRSSSRCTLCCMLYVYRGKKNGQEHKQIFHVGTEKRIVNA